jgi:phage/plasmid-like protein (TIGR03299 family)
MAHQVESLAFAAETPWHGLGTRLSDSATTSIEEMIKQAGLDWSVRVEPLYYAKPTGLGDNTKYIKTRSRVVLRDTDDAQLGIVTDGWTPVQNRAAFDWFQPFLDKGECRFEVAGSLRHGRHVFILARIQEDPIDITPGDPIEPYILLSNGHDGTMAQRVGFTPVRVVCANTLAAAIGQVGEGADSDPTNSPSRLIRLNHNRQVNENLMIVRDTIDLAKRQFIASAELYQEMAKRKIDAKALAAFLTKTLIPKPSKDKKVLQVQMDGIKSKLDTMTGLFESGRGQQLRLTRGTLFAAYNAITEYLNYQSGRSQDVRLDSLFFGNGGTTSQRALNLSAQVVKGTLVLA